MAVGVSMSLLCLLGLLSGALAGHAETISLLNWQSILDALLGRISTVLRVHSDMM